MVNAVQVASLYATLDLRDNLSPSLESAKTSLSSVGSYLDSVGSKLTTLGGSITAFAAPLAAGFGVAISQAASFDEAVTNSGAILGYTREEIEALKDQLLDYGGSVREGPQSVAEAFYDIVGGVADASTHMAILESSVATAQAGNADLAGTTRALISVMNSYKFGADKASYASNVLTRTVGMGVGTMDQMASALPQVTGLANSLGIRFDDLGGWLAYLTTQGNTASESATQLAAMMTAVLKPNETMAAGLAELGFQSGDAAIQQLGLVGAMEALAGTSAANEKGMAAMLGTTEALRGVTALAGDDVAAFMETFKSGVEGATTAAQAIQLSSPAAQFDLLKSKVSEAAIKLGDALIPALADLAVKVQPVIDKIIEWIEQNPELVQQMALIVVGAVVLGGGLIVLGMVLSGLGAVVGIVTGAFGLLSGAVGFLLSPAGLIIAAIVGLVFALSSLYPGGLSKLLSDAATSAQQLAFIFLYHLNNAAQWVRARFEELLLTVQNVIDKIIEFKSWVEGGLGAWQGVGTNASTAVNMVTSGQVSPGDFISSLWNAIRAEAGFSGGGWTGNAPTDQPVGVVHGQEYVVPHNGALVLRGEGSSGVTIENVHINASTAEGGRAAADAFSERLRELMRERG